jgi:hypothetical protein
MNVIAFPQGRASSNSNVTASLSAQVVSFSGYLKDAIKLKPRLEETVSKDLTAPKKQAVTGFRAHNEFDIIPLPQDIFSDIVPGSDAPMQITEEVFLRKRLNRLVGQFNKGRDPAHIAEALVRTIGSNTLHSKITAGHPTVYFHLRMQTTIFMLNGSKYPIRLIKRVSEVLAEKRS